MGQLDPSIPFRALSSQEPHQANPLGLLSGVLTVKRQMGAAADEQHERDALAQFERYLEADPDDPDGALVKLATNGHGEAALRFAEQLGKTRRANALAATAQFDTDGKNLERAGQFLQSVQDQNGWNAYRSRAIELEPRAAAVIPSEYTPEAKQQMLGFHLSAKEWNDAQKAGLTRVLTGDWQGGIGWVLSNAPNAEAYAMTLKAAKQNGAPPEVLALFDREFSPAALTRAAQVAISPKDRATMAATAADRDTDNRRQAADDAEQARHNRVMEARPTGAGASDDDRGDVVETIRGMKDHTIPPEIPARGSRVYTALMAEAHRQGFDLARANQDWKATQKYLATLNGAQQTRLRQAVAFTSDALPLIRELVTEWDSYGIPVLSKKNLDAAAAGTYGNKAQSLARRLKAQIADLTSELGTVYKGGNSSTDESLKLAAENLQGDWSKRAALDALTQIDKNLEMRRGSMRLPPVASEGNAYSPMGTPPPAPAAAPPRGDVGAGIPQFKVKAPNGTTYTFPTQKAADDFKRAAGIP